MKPLHLIRQPGTWAVAQLPAGTQVPAWTGGHEFGSVTHTADEISIICPAAAVPAAIQAERGWALFKVMGPLDFSEVGVLASLAAPLAEAGVPILALGTFQTDYILVKLADVSAAATALRAAGHRCDGV
jgi:hypothetical protein